MNGRSVSLWHNASFISNIGICTYIGKCTHEIDSNKVKYAGEYVHAAILGDFFYTILKTLLRIDMQNMNICL